MDTRKKPSERRKGASPTPTKKSLKVNKDTLKDLEPQARASRHVKGGIPKQPDVDC